MSNQQIKDLNTTREMKDSGIEWIGEVPSEWEVHRLKHYINYTKGKNPQSLNTEQVGTPYIGASDLEKKTELYKMYTTENLPLCSRKDVLVLWDGARSGLIGYNHSGAIGSTVVAISVINAKLESSFLYFLLKGFQNFLIDLTNGTTIPHMNRSFINELGLPLPPLHEQQAITNYLDEQVGKMDELIAEQKTAIEKWKEYKQSLITETVTKGLNPDIEMKDSGIEWMGEIPGNWDISKLRYLGTCKNGISKGAEYFGYGFPFVSYGDIYRNFSVPTEVSGLIDSSQEERKLYSVQEGDVFFTRTSETKEEVGLTSVCLKTIPDATFAGFVIRFRPLPGKLNKNFSKYYFRGEKHRAFFIKEMNVTTRASLGQGLLKDLPVLLPPLHEQQQIADFLDERCTKIDESIEQKQVLIKQLEEYKRSLIYECVTGKKQVI